MKKYRIKKISWKDYDLDGPVKEIRYCIQKRFLCFWFTMNYDDYAKSKMSFYTLEDAREYMNKL